MADDFIVLARDVKAAGLCIVPGTRDFAARFGLDFRDFVKNGIPASRLTALDDALVDRVVAKARERISGR